ncbi:MAG: hypothetical protein RIB64_20195, partial [Arenibacter algicola]
LCLPGGNHTLKDQLLSGRACLTARQAESRPCTVLVFPVRSQETLHSKENFVENQVPPPWEGVRGRTSQ